MTEKPETDRVVTVAELLARHGQASGTSGRAHRRRAREGGISVAELTGEIPIIREPAEAAEAAEPVLDEPAPAATDPEKAASAETDLGAAAPAEVVRDEPAPAPTAEPWAYSALDAVADAGPQSPREFASDSTYSVQSPLASSIMAADQGAAEQGAAEQETVEPELAEPESVPDAAVPRKSGLRQWLALAGQAVLGAVLGAALFIGFERLWDSSLPYVALILAILVILALVAVVRILRKTDDILSVLIAVVVGVIVTIGPLAFVLSTT